MAPWWLPAVLLCALSLAGGALAGRTPRQLLASPKYTAVTTIYNNGLLESSFHNWSWDLRYYNPKDTLAMEGAKSALCLQAEPFGALSLKSSMPFTLDGTLGFYMRGTDLKVAAEGAGAAAGGQEQGKGQFDYGDLELQFESSSPSKYTISKSSTLRELLQAQAPAGSDRAAYAQEKLSKLAAGEWTSFEINMRPFAPQGSTAKFDRLTLGSCQQRTGLCASAARDVAFCLDKMVIVNMSL